MATALFAGSFNPFTIGHHDIVMRALRMFDSVIIAIGRNAKKPDDEAEVAKRRDEIATIYNNVSAVKVICYDGLTTDLASEIGATHLLRGVRSVRDYEYERDLADINRHLTGIDTVILTARADLAYISSSMVRELMSHGKDVTSYLPTTAII